MNIVPMEFEGSSVRIIDQNGEPWFVLADACRILNLEQTHRVADRLDDDEKGRTTITTPGGPQEMTIVNEPGLYSLILTSRQPNAKKFKKWITTEVLPTIRKTGGYGVPNLDDPKLLKQLLLDNLTKRIEAEEKVKAGDAKIAEMQPKANFYDKYADTDGCFNFTEAAKALGIPPKKFIRRLIVEGYCFRQNKELTFYSKWKQYDIFDKRQFTFHGSDGYDHARNQTLITTKGIQYFAAKFAAELPGLEKENV